MSETPPPVPSRPHPWVMRFWVFSAILLGALCIWFYFFVGMVPKFEKIFEDMLGSKEHLPVLTRHAISAARFVSESFHLLLPLCALPFVLLWIRRASGVTPALVLALAVLLVIGTMVAALGMLTALTGVVTNVNHAL